MKIFDSSFDGKVVSLNKKFAWTIMLMSGLLMLAGWQWERITSIADGMWTGPAKPLIGGTTDVTGGPPVATPKVTQLMLRPNEWSQWFELRDKDIPIIDVARGGHRYQFQDALGHSWEKSILADSSQRLGRINCVRFRLKGDGPATVQIIPAP